MRELEIAAQQFSATFHVGRESYVVEIEAGLNNMYHVLVTSTTQQIRSRVRSWNYAMATAARHCRSLEKESRA